jgi:sulfur carrier protein ThiS
MKLLYINNDGSGFADHIEVGDGTTVAAFFEEKMPDRTPGDFLIRVNRQPVAPDQTLQPGDRISITPSKVDGA